MRKIKLKISGLSQTVMQSQSYAVLLSELDGIRKLPIVIGAFEAQAIAVALEKVTINRPLSHDLIKNLFNAFDIQLKEILIDNLLDGIFYAKLICEHEGKEIEIDSRTSDALALAVRFDCPIFTFDFILESAGTILNEPEKENDEPEPEIQVNKFAPDTNKKELSKLTLKELHEKLADFIAHEDYEAAAYIRDEIENRNKR